jgi:hypothetical protein
MLQLLTEQAAHAVLLGEPHGSTHAALPTRPGRTDAELFHRLFDPGVETVDLLRDRVTQRQTS